MALEDGLNDALGSQDPRCIICHRGSLDPLAFWLSTGGLSMNFLPLLALVSRSTTSATRWCCTSSPAQMAPNEPTRAGQRPIVRKRLRMPCALTAGCNRYGVSIHTTFVWTMLGGIGRPSPRNPGTCSPVLCFLRGPGHTSCLYPKSKGEEVGIIVHTLVAQAMERVVSSLRRGGQELAENPSDCETATPPHGRER